MCGPHCVAQLLLEGNDLLNLSKFDLLSETFPFTKFPKLSNDTFLILG